MDAFEILFHTITMRHQHKKYIFYALLVVGVGFCVGGVFVPALFPVGIACISAAVAVAQNLSQQSQPQPQPIPLDHPESNPAEIDIHVPQSDDSLEVDLHIGHRPHLSYRLPKSFPEPDAGPDVDSKDDPDSSQRKNIHRRLP
jgi:hypothetical protein